MTDLHIPLAGNTGKMMTTTPAGKRAILALTFSAGEAEDLRRFAAGITVRRRSAAGPRHPSMSLIARRGVALFEAAFRRDPEGETAKLESMVAWTPKPAKTSKRKDPHAHAAALSDLIGMGPGMDAGRGEL